MRQEMTVTTGNAIAQAAAITEELARQFIAFVDASPQSIATYRASIRRMLAFFKAEGITNPTRADVIRYRDELKAQYKPASVALHMTAARLFFRWTAQQGYYPNIGVRGRNWTGDTKKTTSPAGKSKPYFRPPTGTAPPASGIMQYWRSW